MIVEFSESSGGSKQVGSFGQGLNVVHISLTELSDLFCQTDGVDRIIRATGS